VKVCSVVRKWSNLGDQGQIYDAGSSIISQKLAQIKGVGQVGRWRRFLFEPLLQSPIFLRRETKFGESLRP
jgi:hypothetical protein